jgi:hypothetical protein
MPDVREVYEMVTKQKPTDMGALERQRTRQIRAMRNRKFGAIVVAAAIGAAAVVFAFASRTDTDRTKTGTDVTPTPEVVARRFMDAYGAFDADGAIGYLSDDADVSLLVTSIGDPGAVQDAAGLRLSIAYLEAVGYEQFLDSCDERSTSADGTVARVQCSFDIHLLRSGEIGRGPFGPVKLDLTVRGGEIILASAWDFDYAKGFSAQMWEPFRDWVYAKHPKDAQVMYAVEGTYTALSPESNRLWERYTKAWVKVVNG